MADTSNLSQFLTDVADAIKEKTGKTDKIPAANFDTEIKAIETGVDTSDATAKANDIFAPKTAYVNGEKITGAIQTQVEMVDVPAGTLETRRVTLSGDSSNWGHVASSPSGEIVVAHADSSGSANLRIYLWNGMEYEYKNSAKLESGYYTYTGFVTEFGFNGNEDECCYFDKSNSTYSSTRGYIYNKTTNEIRIVSNPAGVSTNYIQTLYQSGGKNPIIFSNSTQAPNSCYFNYYNGTKYVSDDVTCPDMRPVSSDITAYTYCIIPISTSLIIQPIIGKKSTDTIYKMYSNAYLRTGATFTKVQTSVSDLIPNYNLTYTIDNGEIKKLSFSMTDGSYSTESLSTKIIIPMNIYCWLANDVILCTDVVNSTTGGVVYKVDFTNFQLIKLCDYSSFNVSIASDMYKNPSVIWNFGNDNSFTFRTRLANNVANIQKYTWNTTQEDKVTSIIKESTTFSNVSDGDITADDVVKGKTGYGLNGKVYGNLEVGLTKAEYEEALATTLLIKPDLEDRVRDDEMEEPEL